MSSSLSKTSITKFNPKYTIFGECRASNPGQLDRKSLSYLCAMPLPCPVEWHETNFSGVLPFAWPGLAHWGGGCWPPGKFHPGGSCPGNWPGSCPGNGPGSCPPPEFCHCLKSISPKPAPPCPCCFWMHLSSFENWDKLGSFCSSATFGFIWRNAATYFGMSAKKNEFLDRLWLVKKRDGEVRRSSLAIGWQDKTDVQLYNSHNRKDRWILLSNPFLASKWIPGYFLESAITGSGWPLRK